MEAFRGGAPKYAIDILDLYEFVIALCLTLTNLPFVITCHHNHNTPTQNQLPPFLVPTKVTSHQLSFILSK